MSFNRRRFLQGAGLVGSAALGAGLMTGGREALAQLGGDEAPSSMSQMRAQGTTNTDDFDPYAFATDYHWGDEIHDLGDGRKRRIYRITAIDKEIEVAPGVSFPCWTYNGQVPGPTLRAREGDEIKIIFRNDGEHPHTMHFHGIHRPSQDGIPGQGDGMIHTGEETTYEFLAEPYGTHLYHCHSTPLKRHIHKGLYGAFIVDPPLENGYDDLLGTADREFVMVMNGFDTNFDGDNEIYAVNTKAFCYAERPLTIRQDELVRIHLVNTTEFDPINSFHLHAHFFDYYDTGRVENRRTWVDTIKQIQAQRGILQFRAPFPGDLMFHAHQSEFAELGWLGFFNVQAAAGIDEESQRARSTERGPADPRYSNNGDGAGQDVLGDVDEAVNQPPSQQPAGAAETTAYQPEGADATPTRNESLPEAGTAETSEASTTKEAVERVIEESGGALR